MPWLSCYLSPLTLTCLGHEMAASCLTFPLCSNVTVSSYSFMVIADKKPQPWLYTPVDWRRPSAQLPLLCDMVWLEKGRSFVRWQCWGQICSPPCGRRWGMVSWLGGRHLGFFCWDVQFPCFMRMHITISFPPLFWGQLFSFLYLWLP